jgi:AraC-like DNA-binding protein
MRALRAPLLSDRQQARPSSRAGCFMQTEVSKNYVYLWGGQFMYVGRFEDITEHSHHALQILFDRKGLLRMRSDGIDVECRGAIIGADCRHQLLSSSDSQVHIWIDKESAAAKLISRQHLQNEDVKILDDEVLARLGACIGTDHCLGTCEQARGVYDMIVSELGGRSGPSGESLDPRIVATITLLREHYLSRKLSIAAIARHACLSESRLIHLFSEQVGIPLRRYVLWMRLLTAFRTAAKGERSLTEAAHYAGFSDSAHLSRTSRAMFGITPSGCANSQFIQVHSCFS